MNISGYCMLVLPARYWLSFGKVFSFALTVVLVQLFDYLFPHSFLIFYQVQKTGKLKCSYKWIKSRDLKYSRDQNKEDYFILIAYLVG